MADDPNKGVESGLSATTQRLTAPPNAYNRCVQSPPTDSDVANAKLVNDALKTATETAAATRIGEGKLGKNLLVLTSVAISGIVMEKLNLNISPHLPQTVRCYFASDPNADPGPGPSPEPNQ
jgi:hypothetical protein